MTYQPGKRSDQRTGIQLPLVHDDELPNNVSKINSRSVSLGPPLTREAVTPAEESFCIGCVARVCQRIGGNLAMMKRKRSQ